MRSQINHLELFCPELTEKKEWKKAIDVMFAMMMFVEHVLQNNSEAQILKKVWKRFALTFLMKQTKSKDKSSTLNL